MEKTQKPTNKGAKPISVAIDGFSSSGKSTMAKRLAKETGYRYVDTGAMYRAIALAALDKGIIGDKATLDHERAKAIEALAANSVIDFAIMPDGSQHTTLDGHDVEQRIRGIDVSNAVSAIAALPGVREVLTRRQVEMGRDGGVVMDGRDIGTTVLPGAELKIYVNASADKRARRRYDELTAKGENVSYQEVLTNVMSRDHLDMTRKTSPLSKAADAIELDNSDMTPDQQQAWLMDKFNTALARNGK